VRVKKVVDGIENGGDPNFSTVKICSYIHERIPWPKRSTSKFVLIYFIVSYC
jgi:hypothetical protein